MGRRLQRDPADGKILRDPDSGKLIVRDSATAEPCECCPETCDTCQDGPATVTLDGIVPCTACYEGSPDGSWSVTGSLSGTFELTRDLLSPCRYVYTGSFTGMQFAYYPDSPTSACSGDPECATNILTVELQRISGDWFVYATLSGECEVEPEIFVNPVARVFYSPVTLSGDFCGIGSCSNTLDCTVDPIEPYVGTPEVGTGGTADVTLPAD